MNLAFLENTPLFRGISPKEVDALKQCLSFTERKYKKQEIIYRSGEYIHSIGIVLSGQVCIEHNDIWGNNSILDRLGSGQIFAESYACSPNTPLLVNVVASTDVTVLFLDVNRIVQMCHHACSYHARLIQNLLAISAQKNINLSRKIFHTSAKSIRGRILSYLSAQATAGGSTHFDIPFNRQQLADYLNVDRSALSNELSKMKREGILLYHKNHFTILELSMLEQ